MNYAVFGCGNHDWVATYQRIPTLIDTLAAERGAERLLERGAGDAGASDFFNSFDKWEEDLWIALAKVGHEQSTSNLGSSAHIRSQTYRTEATVEDSGLKIETVETGSARAQRLRQPDTVLGTVTQNYALTAPGAPVKRHIG